MKLPMALEMKGKKVLVVGGGCIGLRKARELVKAEAEVVVVSDVFTTGFNDLSHCTRIYSYYERRYTHSMALVVAATNNKAVNDQVGLDCKEAGIWCMRADDVAMSEVNSMAIHRDGDLSVAVSTNGQSPGYSKHVMEILKAALPDNVGLKLHLLGVLRESVKKSRLNHEKRKQVMAHAVRLDIATLTEMIRRFNLAMESRHYEQFESDFLKTEEPAPIA